MRERDLKALEYDKVIALVREFAVSEPGRRAITALRPAVDAVVVRERLRATAEMARLRARSGSVPISEFDDQQEHLLGAAPEDAVLNGASLVRIRDFVVAARTAAGFLRSRVEMLPQVAAVAQNLVAPKELADAMLRALADDGGMLDDASPELKRVRTRLRDERLGLETRLGRSLNAAGMEPFVSDYIVTVRNRRFVLPLKLNYSERLEGIVQDRSVSGETLFVEPLWAVELNNRLMMLEREAEAEEYRLLMRLTAMVRGYLPELQMTFAALVELDALNARAIFAERFNCIEPELTEDGIELIAARHPLLLTSGREVVPIELRIAPGQHGIVISGPNTGGKTVALKTLGVFALMAQAGLLIPAREGSKIQIFRSVFADIGDAQSIAASLSSFAAHITNLSEIIRSLREPALVILDEPGGGTDPVEGAALAMGLMDYLSERGCVVAISTHSTAVKLHAYSRAGFEAAAVDFDPERLAPLYRLKPHTIGQSYGLAVARRLGLPVEIVSAAEAALPAGTAELGEALRRLEEERARLQAQTERLGEREQAAADRERDTAEAAERARLRTEAERERVRSEGARAIEELRREGSVVLAELKAGTKGRRELGQTLANAATRIEQVLPRALENTASPADAPLKVGDQVELGEIRGALIAIDQDRAVVGRGGLRIEVAADRLRRARPATAPVDEPRVTVTADASGRDELNLVGMRTAEGLRRLEEFLDQAYLTNQTEVRVIHGIGSGALKKAVHDYLRSSPYCASFRLAEPHFGGAGCTIVEMGR
ncbi:MAG TPA: Smr/MutS family protein [Candidatus Binataceae bacterium]|jgi:DNA mismatch repair protein MutS2|nr:Smr/MutS family protein [Candidatus Binataceae bacterium]